jgi:hypothetical protein
VRQLPGWPVSASALLDWLRQRITRGHLLSIANSDPFGAHEHFPILVKVWASGRVPAPLRFSPGEALELYRWSSGPNVDHLSRAFCCALLCISPDESDFGDDPASVAAPLVESCLALGGDAPALAERLLAWQAVNDPPCIASLPGDHASPDPVILLALILLRAAIDPGDARLPDLARTVADAFTRPDTLPWHFHFPASVSEMTGGGHAMTWQHLVTDLLAPLSPTHPSIDRLTAGLLDHQPVKHGQRLKRRPG